MLEVVLSLTVSTHPIPPLPPLVCQVLQVMWRKLNTTKRTDLVRTLTKSTLGARPLRNTVPTSLGQDTRHTPQLSTRHCVFSAAPEITFVSTPFSLPLTPSSSSMYPFSPQPLPSPSPPPYPFFYHLRQAHRAGGCPHGVKLLSTNGHWH